MPIIVMDVPETGEAAMTPIITQVAKQVAKTFGLPADMPIQFPGDAPTVAQPQSTLDKSGDPNLFPYYQKFKITAEETYHEERALSELVYRPDQLTFFTDKALDVYLKPVYQRVEVTLNITYRAADFTQADIWLKRAKGQATRGKQDTLHELTYHYPIPIEFMVILCKLYDMREANLPYNEDLGLWLKRCFTPKFTVIANQAGNQETFVIRENQIRVLGWHDFGYMPPKQTKHNEGGAWEVGFSYKFAFDKCTQIVLQYPLMIHNQLIGPDIRNEVLPYLLEDIIREGPVSTQTFDKISSYSQMPYPWQGRPGVPVPTFDDWLPNIEPPSTQNLMRLLIQLDPNDKRALINLGSLGHWRFNSMTKNYMKEAPWSLAKMYECVFKVDLHRRHDLLSSDKLHITDDLDIMHVDELDEREYYHVTINLLYDLSMLSDVAKNRLCLHGGFALYLLRTLDPNMKLPTLNADGSISRREFDEAAWWLSQRRVNGINYYSGAYGWYLVGQFIVVAHTQEDTANAVG